MNNTYCIYGRPGILYCPKKTATKISDTRWATKIEKPVTGNQFEKAVITLEKAEKYTFFILSIQIFYSLCTVQPTNLSI